MNKIKEKSIYPLAVFSIFTSISEFALMYGATKLTGWQQNLLLIFSIFFPIAIACFFAHTLINKPWVFYPPSEYDKPNVQAFINSMKGAQKDTTVNKSEKTFPEKSIIEESMPKPISDSEKQDNDNESDPTESTDKDISPKANWFLEFYSKKNYKKSLEIAEENLINTHKDDLVFWRTAKARSLIKLEYHKGLQEAQLIIKEFPNNFNSYYTLSTTYFENKQYQEAINIYQEALVNVTDNQDRTAIKLHMASCYGKLDDVNKQKNILEEVIKESTDPDQTASGYRRLADIYKTESNTDKATTFYLYAYQASPLNTYNLGIIADFFNEISDYKRELFFRKTINELEPSENSWTLLGNCYLSNNLLSLALDAYEKGNELADGKQGWIIGNIANIYSAVGFYNKALPMFREALVIDPESQFVHERLAMTLNKKETQITKETNILKNVTIDPKVSPPISTE